MAAIISSNIRRSTSARSRGAVVAQPGPAAAAAPIARSRSSRPARGTETSSSPVEGFSTANEPAEPGPHVPSMNNSVGVSVGRVMAPACHRIEPMPVSTRSSVVRPTAHRVGAVLAECSPPAPNRPSSLGFMKKIGARRFGMKTLVGLVGLVTVASLATTVGSAAATRVRRGRKLHHVDGERDSRRGGQARLADHPGEQVLRRDVHRAQPEQLPVEDAARAGRAAEELLRHRPLQPGQLHLDGLRPGSASGRPERLPGHADAQGSVVTSRAPRTARPPTAASSPRPALPTPTRSPAAPPKARTAARAASTRPASRRCSTSSTPPA